MAVLQFSTDLHVLVCAVRACHDHMAALHASVQWADPYKPTQLPRIAAGGYDAAGVPLGGGFYARELAIDDTERPAPFVEFYLQQASTIEPYSDTEADFHRVTIGMRARYGGSAKQATALHNRAMAMANLALMATVQNLRATAIVLEPATAYGICYAMIGSDPVPDVTSAKPGESSGTVSVDAIASIVVMQRQFSPAAFGQ